MQTSRIGTHGAVVATLAALAISTGVARAEGPSCVSGRFDRLLVLETAEGGRRVIYADAQGHVHAYRYDSGRPVLVWETTTLGSPASALWSEDVDGDGGEEIVVATTGGRILFYGVDSYELLWENVQDSFAGIRCLVVGNVDDDPQAELIFTAGPSLIFFDCRSKLVEWEGEGFADVGAMALGNLDDDPHLELALNTGVIFDTGDHRAEFEAEEGFGEQVGLLDLTGDGIPEVIGEAKDRSLRVFDVRAHRELW